VKRQISNLTVQVFELSSLSHKVTHTYALVANLVLRIIVEVTSLPRGVVTSRSLAGHLATRWGRWL
jgi:hypothetical protein